MTVRLTSEHWQKRRNGLKTNIVTLFLLFRLALLVEPLERKTERKNYYSHRFMKITANYLKFIATIFLS